ncbi:MAG: hypothetical protein ACOC36_05955 [Fibrobacterota bacterium]
MKHLRFILCTFTASSLFIYAGCNSSPVSTEPQGSTDAGSLGQMAFASVEESSDLDNLFGSMQTATQLLSEQPPMAIEAPAPELTKSQAGASEWKVSVKGEQTVVTRTVQGVLKTTFDTLIVRTETAPDLFNVIEARCEHVYASQKEKLVISDADGDGIVNGEEQYNGTAKLTFTVIRTGDGPGFRNGETETSEIKVSCGPDKSFDLEEDNLILEAKWVKYLNDQKIAHAIYTDADEDDVLWSENGSGVTEVELFNSKDPSRPHLDNAMLVMRVSKTGNTEKVVRIAGREEYISGRVSQFWALDEQGDSTITPNELAYVHFKTVSAPSDAEKSAHVVYVINPGENLGDESDNVLHEIHVDRENRNGLIKLYQFSFVADPPVPNGQEPSGGTFEMNVTHFDNSTAALVGSFSETHLTATHTDREGTVRQVTVDKSGNVTDKDA